MKTLILLFGLLFLVGCSSSDDLDCGIINDKKIIYDKNDMPVGYTLTVDGKTFPVSKEVYYSYRPTDTYCF